MSRDERNDPIDILNPTNEQSDKTMEAKTVRLNASGSRAKGTSEFPAEKDPGIKSTRPMPSRKKRKAGLGEVVFSVDSAADVRGVCLCKPHIAVQ